MPTADCCSKGRPGASSRWPRPGTTAATARSCRGRSPAAAAFMNAMTLDIAMGGSTNTVLHLLAIAHEAGVDFTMADIDGLSRKVPNLCKVSPSSTYHVEDVNRAGGIMAILGELDRAGLLDTRVCRVDSPSLKETLDRLGHRPAKPYQGGGGPLSAAPPAPPGRTWSSVRRTARYPEARPRPHGRLHPGHRTLLQPGRRSGRPFRQYRRRRTASSRPPGSIRRSSNFPGPPGYSRPRKLPARPFSAAGSRPAMS